MTISNVSGTITSDASNACNNDEFNIILMMVLMMNLILY